MPRILKYPQIHNIEYSFTFNYLSHPHFLLGFGLTVPSGNFRKISAI